MHALCGRECRHACATVCVAVRGQPQVSGPSVHLVFETRSLCCFFCALQLASLGTLLSPNSHFPMGTLGFTEACTSMPGLLRGLQLVELSSSSLHASAPPLSYLPTAALQTFAIVLLKKMYFYFREILNLINIIILQTAWTQNFCFRTWAVNCQRVIKLVSTCNPPSWWLLRLACNRIKVKQNSSGTARAGY